MHKLWEIQALVFPVTVIYPLLPGQLAALLLLVTNGVIS